MTSPYVGFVGAGQMGAPMVARMVAGGVQVAVFVRRPEVAARLSEAGAVIVSGLAELAECSSVVICCVFSDKQLLEVTLSVGGLVSSMRPGSVLVSHTTGTEATLRTIAEAAAQRECVVVDAPVSGTAAEIARGELTILLGDQGRVADMVTPILATYSSQVLRTGGMGSALRLKLVNNLLFAANFQLAAEAVELGAKLGIAEKSLIETVVHCSGSSSALERAVEVGGVRAFCELAAPFLKKDLDACFAAVRELGQDVGALGQAATRGPFDFSSGQDLPNQER
jgi:3-hydroxyisobutyrate dehydrogenase-like beta-hydroxyacid dehydrogenase